MGRSEQTDATRPAFLDAHRRAVLRAGLAAAALGSFTVVRPAAAAAASLSVTALPGGLKLISGGGANVVCASGPDGALMVDGGLAASADQMVERVLAETRARQVALLVNTCWRLEHTGANDKLGASGVRIVAQENTRLWMGTEIDSRWEKTVYPPRAPQARPNHSFYTAEVLAAGPGAVACGRLLQAHTDGDAYVHFQDANVVAVGGAVAGRGWPLIDTSTGGWIGGHVRGLETLIGLADDKTVVVPAEGPPLAKADLEKQHAMYVAIMGRLQTLLESGSGLAEVLKAAPAADYAAERGDPTLFTTLAFRSFWGHARQFKAI